MAGTTVARRRLEALIDEHGVDGLSAGIEDYLAYAERLTRQELGGAGAGHLPGSYLIDNDGIDLERSHRIEVAVTVEGDGAVFDFPGTSPRWRQPSTARCHRRSRVPSTGCGASSIRPSR